VSDQTVAILVGFGTVVGLRLLDWVFPKGYAWRKVKEWSIQLNNDSMEDDDDD
jgi:hypothetical protein